jgi:S1-C subfamily serine protease
VSKAARARWGRAKRAVSARASVLVSVLVSGWACVWGLGCGHRPVDYGGVAVLEGSLESAKRAEAAIQRSAAAVAIIETDVARGMGFVVDPSGYLITNRHVVEDADHIEGVVFPARDPSRVYGSVRVIYIDPLRDLALLHVHSPEPLTALPLATDAMVPVTSYLASADPVVLMLREVTEDDETAPSLALQRGQVSRLAVENAAAGPGAFVGVTTDVRQGQSGGPVLDRHGRAVGVVTWTWRDRGGGYAIPIADATRMLAERPRLAAETDRKGRAELRARLFLDAMSRSDGPAARRFTSPSEARKLREDTVGRIMAAAQEDAGLAIMQAFVAALDEVVDDAQQLEDPALAEQALAALVLGMASSNVQRTLGHDLPLGQVISFFHELGDTYLQARLFLGEDTEAALRSALEQLRTIDAARSFALAALITDLDGRDLTVRTVELLPGAYASGARVELEASPGPAAAAGAEIFDLYLRLEWGDFYVTALERAPLP